MAYFVTGATGFIGRNLVERLLRRPATSPTPDIYVLVREGSRHRFEALLDHWEEQSPGATERIKPVTGDLTSKRLGVNPRTVTKLRGLGVQHFFHLAAIYDMTADSKENRTANVEGTSNALALADALNAGCFHHVSSIAVAGEYEGTFTEEMFDEGQRLPHPYHETKFESELLVREHQGTPWRIYRPSIVVGDSRTGEMDKLDGPYYFFPLLKALGDALPSWLPLIGIEFGHTNLVPVDYVVDAIDHIAHVPALDGRTFQLVNPLRQRSADVINTLAKAAGAPQLMLKFDLGSVGATSADALKTITGLPGAKQARAAVLQAFGIPDEVIENMDLIPSFSSAQTAHALEGSGIELPPFESYAGNLWTYWEGYMDGARARHYSRYLDGKTVMITGASSGIGKATAIKVAAAGGIPLLVARGIEKLNETKDLIERLGATAYAYPADIADGESVDELVRTVLEDHGSVDILINNAGRSIRRSIALSYDRFHDFERTVQLNYLGTVRLTMGLLPSMRESKSGHVINISSIGVQTNPPRFSAYIASKSALDAWTRVVSSECIGDNVHFTTVHMPLVKTPMIAPTKLYDRVPTISPEEAADMILGSLRHRPKTVSTPLGTLGEVTYAVFPKLVDQILHRAYKVFPDSAAARGADDPTEHTSLHQQIFAKVWRGVYW